MTKESKVLRLRVFAGPNGSGKSTVIKSVGNASANGFSIDFGLYINADDIAQSLKKGYFSFSKYALKKVTSQLFVEVAISSGLIDKSFTENNFRRSFILEKGKIISTDPKTAEKLAQIIADFLRKRLLAERKKFSFETVFSHAGKLQIMDEAVKAGYKVYLYYVSTESPDINVTRVLARVKDGGHDVPTEKIESRYYRSLGLLYDAAQLAYQAYFFDNSSDRQKANLFAHFKKENGEKTWDIETQEKNLPNWFVEYYINKIPKS